MEVIEFIDTEGRFVQIMKPLLDWSGWNIRIDNDPYGGVSRNEDGKWEFRSIRMTMEDFDAIIWVIESYMLNKYGANW